MSAADRIAIADALLDQEVEEQTHDRQPELERRVRESGARVDRDYVRATRTRPLPQVPNIRGDLSAPRIDGVDVVAPAEPQEVDQRSAIGVDGARRAAKIGLHRQPACPQRTRGERWPALHEPSLPGDILI